MSPPPPPPYAVIIISLTIAFILLSALLVAWRCRKEATVAMLRLRKRKQSTEVDASQIEEIIESGSAACGTAAGGTAAGRVGATGRAAAAQAAANEDLDPEIAINPVAAFAIKEAQRKENDAAKRKKAAATKKAKETAAARRAAKKGPNAAQGGTLGEGTSADTIFEGGRYGGRGALGVLGFTIDKKEGAPSKATSKGAVDVKDIDAYLGKRGKKAKAKKAAEAASSGAAYTPAPQAKLDLADRQVAEAVAAAKEAREL